MRAYELDESLTIDHAKKATMSLPMSDQKKKLFLKYLDPNNIELEEALLGMNVDFGDGETSVSEVIGVIGMAAIGLSLLFGAGSARASASRKKKALNQVVRAEQMLGNIQVDLSPETQEEIESIKTVMKTGIIKAKQQADINADTSDSVPSAKTNSIDIEKIKDRILSHEAVKFNKAEVVKRINAGTHDDSSYRMWTADGDFRVYKDSLGKLTVGIGHLIDSNSPFYGKTHGDTVSYEEGMSQFDKDVNAKIKHLNAAIKKHPNLKYVDYAALVDVQFQMGSKVWKTFTDTMSLIDAGNFMDAAEEVKRSKWYKDTPKRVEAISKAFKDAGARLASLKTTQGAKV